MIEFSKQEIHGWEAAIRGMRNPMNSWEKSDSRFNDIFEDCLDGTIHLIKSVYIGENDLELMTKLAVAGSVHAKYRRMITVYVDILAPLYWWKEFDTYKVGTVANSCSTMHKIHEKEFRLNDFSHEQLMQWDDGKGTIFVENFDGKKYICTAQSVLEHTINALNHYRAMYINTKDNRFWWQMIQLLPSSYNQKRTVMLNYEVLSSIYRHRKDHKLDEWRDFCQWIERLPYSEIIMS